VWNHRECGRLWVPWCLLLLHCCFRLWE
jgi:hypothetical protein